MALKIEFTNDPFNKPDFFICDSSNRKKLVFQSSVPHLLVEYFSRLDDSELEDVRETINSLIDDLVGKESSHHEGQRSQVMVEKSTEPVTFFRYYRRLDDKTGEICNKYGVTVRFTMDFASRVVYASASICNGDNFRKTIGRAYAEASPYLYRFPMPDEMTEDNCLYHQLVNALDAMLTNDSICSANARRFSKRLLNELLNV